MPNRDLLDQLLAAVDEAHDEIVALCQDLVRIPTVNFGTPESGDELPAAEHLRDKLAADGIDSTIYKSAENRANIVADYNAGASGPRLLYMSHTDVVPVEDESQWTYPPFGAEIHDDRIWGRGATDMKDTVAAQAMALCLLKRAGFEPNGQLTFASCADEEAGGAFGFGWQATHHPETLRADFGVNEGGGTPTRAGDRTIYPISTGEKGRLEIHFRVTGRGFHASEPWRASNAIYMAENLIQRIREYQPVVSVEADIFDHLETLAGITEEPTNDNVDRIIEQVGQTNFGLSSQLRAQSRLTLVATMIRAGVKSNSVAENCTIVCDVRSLPSQDVSYVRKQAAQIADGLDGVTFEVIETAVSNRSSFDSPFRAHVEAATKAAVGIDDLTFIPGMTVGFTDSRFVRPLGNVTYGFIPSHPDDDPSLGGAHNINESTGIKSLIAATKFHVALALETLG
jgi:acetylornithine deacetylase/succinyl-diaminopimelate desuccinylase-like protein